MNVYVYTIKYKWISQKSTFFNDFVDFRFGHFGVRFFDFRVRFGPGTVPMPDSNSERRDLRFGSQTPKTHSFGGK